ncbi:MAG: hypothetical protein ABSD02_25075 [Steroidobacteraceae bacterium]|jgi:hypothetical protein
MTKRLTRIAPWQAGKLFALIYFATSFIFVIPMALITSFAPMPPGPGPKIGPGILMLMPFLYGLAGLIFVPIGCGIYNLAAKFAGGLQVTVTDSA